jgi:hypothetical protein
MKRVAFVLGLAALLWMTALTACGDGGESMGSSSAPTAETSSSEDSCAISTAALGLVVALATKGKELEEIGEAVSSKPGGDVLSAACKLAVQKFINEPQAEVPLTLKIPSGPTPLQASLDQIRQALNTPPPQPSSDPCLDWEAVEWQNLCLRGIISPPLS